MKDRSIAVEIKSSILDNILTHISLAETIQGKDINELKVLVHKADKGRRSLKSLSSNMAYSIFTALPQGTQAIELTLTAHIKEE